ncbi:histidine kinase [Streptomyces sp. NPDC051320]|uniref:sensor histidine kinase n=1 Tax=Streptomyces sp. NPDC051320 TaxID=3154644 RepID=UPI00342ACFEF
MNPLFGSRARLRWTHLILGGALLMPYFMLGTVAVGVFAQHQDVFASLPLQLVTFACALPIGALSALFVPARPLSVFAVHALCGVDSALLADRPARSWAARVRTSGWFTLHIGLGGVVSALTLATPPLAGVLLVLPFCPPLRNSRFALPEVFGGWAVLLAPFAGVALLLVLACCAAGAAELLARAAPALLGPTPADRLAAAERRAADLAVRNRVARELHDSVGHALSAVTLQASAARRVLDSDLEFVREALTAIEETTRRTVGELDSVLGLLRQGEEGASTPTGPGLEALAGLLAHCGVRVACTTAGDPEQAPAPVSREAYRIVQEGLSNALRYGGAAPVALRVVRSREDLEITMENPLPGPRPPVPPGGGRGLRGMAERAALLGGHASAGPAGGVWRLTALLPLQGDGR